MLSCWATSIFLQNYRDAGDMIALDDVHYRACLTKLYRKAETVGWPRVISREESGVCNPSHPHPPPPPPPAYPQNELYCREDKYSQSLKIVLHQSAPFEALFFFKNVWGTSPLYHLLRDGRSVTPFFVLVLDTTLNELIVHIEEYRYSGESLPMADMTTL